MGIELMDRWIRDELSITDRERLGIRRGSLIRAILQRYN
jgi:hypothetical protein